MPSLRWPRQSIKHLQLIKNSAARLVTGTRPRDRISPVRVSLHWQSVIQDPHLCVWSPESPCLLSWSSGPILQLSDLEARCGWGFRGQIQQGFCCAGTEAVEQTPLEYQIHLHLRDFQKYAKDPFIYCRGLLGSLVAVICVWCFCVCLVQTPYSCYDWTDCWLLSQV